MFKKKKKITRPSLKLRRARKKKSRKYGQQIRTLEPRELIHRTRIRVIGIGGGGSSIVSEIASQVPKADFIAVNTDVQALKQTSRGVKRLHFGENLTRGLGCGMDVRLGQKVAREERQKIAKLFKGVDLCILIASLGAGTGSGAAPEFAKIARDLKIMTFGIFTLPFKFEGGKKAQIARNSLRKAAPYLNALAIIPNENIFQIIDKETPVKEAFSAINKRLAADLTGLCEMIYLPGLVNIDFADLKTILEGRGKLAYLNSTTCQGPNRTEEVLKQLLKSPLNEYTIQGAEKIVFNITASQNLGMKEVEQISQTIANFNRRAKIIFGVSQNNNYRDKVRITLLALGCGKKPKLRPKPAAPKGSEPRPEKSGREPSKVEKPKPKKRRIRRKKTLPIGRQAKKVNPVSVPVPVKEVVEEKVLTRRNALDLKKQEEKTEMDLLEQEKKWDIPAFLRRGNEESK